MGLISEFRRRWRAYLANRKTDPKEDRPIESEADRKTRMAWKKMYGSNRHARRMQEAIKRRSLRQLRKQRYRNWLYNRGEEHLGVRKLKRTYR